MKNEVFWGKRGPMRIISWEQEELLAESDELIKRYYPPPAALLLPPSNTQNMHFPFYACIPEDFILAQNLVILGTIVCTTQQ